MHNTKKPVFIYSQELEKYSYPPDSMFVPQRAAKTRELLMSLGLLDGKCGRESAPVRATKSELKNFHSTKYLEALQRAADGKMSREHLSMGLAGTRVETSTYDLPIVHQHCPHHGVGVCRAPRPGGQLGRRPLIARLHIGVADLGLLGADGSPLVFAQFLQRGGKEDIFLLVAHLADRGVDGGERLLQLPGKGNRIIAVATH